MTSSLDDKKIRPRYWEKSVNRVCASPARWLATVHWENGKVEVLNYTNANMWALLMLCRPLHEAIRILDEEDEIGWKFPTSEPFAFRKVTP